jgi:hypothetical protein
MKMKLAKTAVMAALATTGAAAQTNLGAQKPEARLPFVMTQVATFIFPWRLAFLPDGRMLITEKVGPIWLVTQTGKRTPVANAPAVLYDDAATSGRRIATDRGLPGADRDCRRGGGER